MIKVGIVIDSWKLPVFKSHLTKAGYIIKKRPGPTPGTVILKTMTNSAEEFKAVIQAAADETRKMK